MMICILWLVIIAIIIAVRRRIIILIIDIILMPLVTEVVSVLVKREYVCIHKDIHT